MTHKLRIVATEAAKDEAFEILLASVRDAPICRIKNSLMEFFITWLKQNTEEDFELPMSNLENFELLFDHLSDIEFFLTKFKKAEETDK